MDSKNNKNVGWSVFIAVCQDGTYFTSLCKNILRRVRQINSGMESYVYFCKNPERLPIKIMYKETGMSFFEAYAKSRYLKKMTRRQRQKLIDTHRWPVGGEWKEYLKKNEKLP